MQIGPISGIRPLPTSRHKERETEMPAVFEVEYLGRAGDESYSSNHGGGPPDQDGERDDADGPESDASAGPLVEFARVNQVNLFA
jgi:hypothetical protein